MLLSVFICISLAFSFIVIKDFSGPLIGKGDIAQWEYIGFFVEKNLHFTPLPKLDLINNQVFYPYGTNSVFQTWGLERDFFFSIFHSLFGNGPWLQLYYLLTVLITAFGTFALLVSDYGLARAGGAGLIVSFFNFYTIRKYPFNLNISVVHWTNLSFITDFLSQLSEVHFGSEGWGDKGRGRQGERLSVANSPCPLVPLSKNRVFCTSSK